MVRPPEKSCLHTGLGLGACRTYVSRLDFCPSRKKQASCLLLPSRLRSLPPPSVAAFPRYDSALSSVCESIDSHTPLKRCQNAHAAQLRLSFCPPVGGQAALHRKKIIKNHLDALKSDRLLAIVQGIAVGYGSSVSIRNAPEGGAVFTLEFPRYHG